MNKIPGEPAPTTKLAEEVAREDAEFREFLANMRIKNLAMLYALQPSFGSRGIGA